jgi:hypothetical protein
MAKGAYREATAHPLGQRRRTIGMPGGFVRDAARVRLMGLESIGEGDQGYPGSATKRLSQDDYVRVLRLLSKFHTQNLVSLKDYHHLVAFP